MTTRTVGAGHGWKWIVQGVNVGRTNPRAVYGATAIVAVLALVPNLLQAILQATLGLDMQGQLMLSGVIALLSVPLYALLIGGVLRVIHDVEHGRDARPTDLFRVFTTDPSRLIAFGLLMLGLYVAGAVVLATLFGEGLMAWGVEIMTLSEEAAQATASTPPPALPTPPTGAGLFMLFGLMFGVVCVSIYGIGLGEVALAGSAPVAAFGTGVRGTLRNLLPIAVSAIVAFAAAFALGLAFLLVAVVVGGIAALVHPALAALLLLPLYLVLLLAVYIVMFGAMYAMWRDVCAPEGEVPAGPAPAAGADQGRIEL